MGQRKGGHSSTPSAEEAATPASRLRDLRSATGETGKQLAESIGGSQSLISKLECGQPLSNKWAESLARHFGVTPEFILWGRKPESQGQADLQASGLREDGVAFVADGGGVAAEPATAGKPRKFGTFKLETEDLAALGYPRGSKLVVDFELPEGAHVADGCLVIVEVVTRGKRRRLARQFVAPDLLCCNSGRSTGPVLKTSDASVTIVGIIKGVLEESPLRKPSVKRRRKSG